MMALVTLAFRIAYRLHRAASIFDDSVDTKSK